MQSPGFVSFDPQLDAAFQRQLERAQKAVEDLSPAFKGIAVDFYKYEKTVFRLKGPGQFPDFKGRKIGELREGPMQRATLKRKPIPRSADGMTPYQYWKVKKAKERGYDVNAGGYPLMRFTGDLEKSVTDPKAKNAVLRIGKQEMELGSTDPKLGFHQSDEPRSKMPLRKLLFIPPSRLPAWLNIMNNYVLRSLGATPTQAGTKDQP